MEETRRKSTDPKRWSSLDRIRALDRGYSRADLPWESAFSRLQEDPKKKEKTPMDMRNYYQYHKHHGHDMGDCRHLKIEIEKLIKRGQLKEYVNQETQRMNKCFNQGRSKSPDGPPSITGRVNAISWGCSGGGDSGSARQAYAKWDISVVNAGARPKFLDLSFSRKDFEGIECPYEDPLVITSVIEKYKVSRMLVDTDSSMDILYLDAYLKLGMSWAQIMPVATPLVGFTGDAVSPLGVANLMVTI
ncbi:hypothetical protein LIER_20653 [Lithospermum erythrorhizon]|uniref:Uncharacterized protein n=1 Tax=Lithospermum erythrorhizon TaxID=34254 RepID=A0AAV3QMB6_LITER